MCGNLSPLLPKLLSAHIFVSFISGWMQRNMPHSDAHLETFKWANRTPLLPKEGLGVVSHPLSFKTMIISELLSNHP